MSKIDAKQKHELDFLAKLPDSQIDTSDIPEVKNWKQAEVGKFYRPMKKQITIRVDMDTLDWFQSHFDKYQTCMNLALREFMENHRKAG